MLLFAVLLAVFAFPHAVIQASSGVFSIPFKTWGPLPINATQVQLVNASVYNNSLPPVNYSLPVLRLAGVITQTGAYTSNTALAQQIYPFMVDMINMRGGVKLNNQSYLLSLTTASDDSSPNYLQLLYSTWLSDPTISLFLSPTTDDQYKILLPMMQATNRTWINMLDADPANFYPTNYYPYSWLTNQMKSQGPIPTIASIDQRAQLFYQQVAAGHVTPPHNSHLSSYGLTSMCMYTHNDSAQVQSCQGIRSWIATTNAERSAAGATASDLVSIVTDVFWGLSAISVDQDLYTTTLNHCPDNVDLLVICGEATTADQAAVSAALQATQLRPKAAYSTSTLPGFDATNATMLAQWNGWITHGSPASIPATLPQPTFTTKAQFTKAWQSYYSSSAAITTQQALYPMSFEMLKAALYRTASLSSDDLRAAYLSLNGSTYIRRVLLNPLTGTNDGAIPIAQQIQGAAGAQLVSATYPLVYPNPWPWSRVEVGDPLKSSQSLTTIVVSVVMAVLGCWVGQIIVEQAVYVRRRGGLYPLWLLLVAVAVGGGGVWCSQFNMASAVSISIPVTGVVLPLQWSLWVAVLAWFPAVLITWCGLMACMQKVEASRHAKKEAEEERKKKAALSNVAHFHHLRGKMSWRVAVGGVCVMAAMWLSRVTLWADWSVQATFVGSSEAWVISAVLGVTLVCPAVLMYFYALRWRVTAVFMLSTALVVDWQVHLTMGEFVYQQSVLGAPSALYTVLLSSTAVSVITGIVCAITCFGFVGLQFSRMQLSRNSLSVLVASLESVINKLKTRQTALQQEVTRQRAQADALVKLIECINIVRPIAKEYSFALAMSANMATFTALHDQSTASMLLPSASSPLVVHTREALSPSLSIPSSAAIPASVSRQVLSRHFSSSQPSAAAVANIAQRALSRQSTGENAQGELSAGANGRGDEGRDESPTAPPVTSPFLKCRVAWNGIERQTSDAQSASPVESPPPSHPTKGGDGRGQPEYSSSHSRPDLPSSDNPQAMDHAALTRDFQAQLSSLLAEQSSRRASSPPPGVSSCNGRTPAPDGEFSLSFPSIGRSSGLMKGGRLASSSTTKDSAGDVGPVGVGWHIPSLMQLLHHPVCVEVLKDELERIHSVENIIFFLHALRYRKLLTSVKTRRAVATQLFETFIAEDSPQQINLSTRQRDAVASALRKNRDDTCTPQLFQEAEREVVLLMETNVMKQFTGTAQHRLCVWLYHAVDMGVVLGLSEGGSGDEAMGKNGLIDAVSSNEVMSGQSLKELSQGKSSATRSRSNK